MKLANGWWMMGHERIGFRRPRKLKGRTLPYFSVEHAYYSKGHVARMGNATWNVFTCFLHEAVNDEQTMPSLSEIAEETGLSRKGVVLGIRKLIDQGYIKRERPAKVGDGNTYIIVNLEDVAWVGNSVHQGGELSTPPLVNSVHQGGVLSSPEVVNSVHHPIYKELEEQRTTADTETAAGSLRDLLKEAGIEEPSLSRCCGVPGLTPIGVVMLSELAAKSADRNSAGWMIKRLLNGRYVPPTRVHPEVVKDLINAERIYSIRGRRLAPGTTARFNDRGLWLDGDGGPAPTIPADDLIASSIELTKSSTGASRC